MSSWPWRQQSLCCGTVVLFLVAAGCGGSSNPQVPAEITLNTTDVTLAAAGQSQQLTATVLDEGGGPIPNPSVQWESSDPTIVGVSSTGLLTGQSPGTAEVTATAGQATASATVIVQSTASLEVADGNGQTAAAGAAVTTPPAVRVRDGSGDPVSGVRVLFQVGSASGSVTGGSQTTGADGIARVGSWRLGASGVNTLTAIVENAEVAGEPAEFIATTADPAGYNITIVYVGPTPTASQALAFAEAELRWESIITGDLPDVNQDLPANFCQAVDNPATPGPFDDLTIFATIDSIDGPFAVLGQAGPCAVRVQGGQTGQTVIGQMLFDEADLEFLETDGSLQAVILHEMGHVLGFGTLWGPPPNGFDLLADPADTDAATIEDSHFTGANALTEFNAAGGGPYAGAKVPVENVGAEGTINSHWRESVFDQELMTGFLNDGTNPLSRISVRSLQDMGYTVDVAGADPYTLNLSALRIAGPRRGRPLINDIINEPIRMITLDGRVVGVIRR